MIKPILQLGNDTLTEVSEEVRVDNILSRETVGLITNLKDTANEDKKDTAGLSAVQIGTLKRIYIVRRIDLESSRNDSPKWEVMINPKVEVLGNEFTTYWEGCMSIGTGDDRIFGPVERPSWVKVIYFDEEGREQSFEAKDYMAHIVQHEQDHLDGILFLKHVKNPKNLWKSCEIDEYLEQNGTYPSIED